MANIPEFLHKLLNEIAATENFIHHQIEFKAGCNHGDGFLSELLSVIIHDQQNKKPSLHLICKLAPSNPVRRREFESITLFKLTADTLHSIHSMRYEEEGENSWGCASWFEYLIVIVLSTILLIGALVLTLFWVIYYRGGFAWSENPKIQFNLHPVLMVGGFITLSGFSILFYRLCRCLKHIYVKLAHTFFHACTIPCVVIGFLAVFDSHNLANPPMPNFYTLHSWLGLVTMGLFVLQFVFGFFTFLVCLCCEHGTYSCRAAMVPIHASFGLVTFMLACGTCLTGLTQKAIWTLGAQYSEWQEEGIIINAIGATIIALGVVISFAVRRSNAPATAKVYVTERL